MAGQGTAPASAQTNRVLLSKQEQEQLAVDVTLGLEKLTNEQVDALSDVQLVERVGKIAAEVRTFSTFIRRHLRTLYRLRELFADKQQQHQLPLGYQKKTWADWCQGELTVTSQYVNRLLAEKYGNARVRQAGKGSTPNKDANGVVVSEDVDRALTDASGFGEMFNHFDPVQDRDAHIKAVFGWLKTLDPKHIWGVYCAARDLMAERNPGMILCPTCDCKKERKERKAKKGAAKAAPTPKADSPDAHIAQAGGDLFQQETSRFPKILRSPQ
jgi:hypothetical protein